MRIADYRCVQGRVKRIKAAVTIAIRPRFGFDSTTTKNEHVKTTKAQRKNVFLSSLYDVVDVAVQETLEQLGVEFESTSDETDASDARRIISCAGLRVIAFTWSSDWTLRDTRRQSQNCTNTLPAFCLLPRRRLSVMTAGARFPLFPSPFPFRPPSSPCLPSRPSSPYPCHHLLPCPLPSCVFPLPSLVPIPVLVKSS